MSTDALIRHMAEVGGASLNGQTPPEALFFRQVEHDGDSHVARLRSAANDLDPRAFAKWRPALLNEVGDVVGVCVGADARRMDLDFLLSDRNAARKLAHGVFSGAVIGTRRACPQTAKLVDHIMRPDATFKFTRGGELQKRLFTCQARETGDVTLDALKKIHAAGPGRYGPW